MEFLNLKPGTDIKQDFKEKKKKKPNQALFDLSICVWARVYVWGDYVGGKSTDCQASINAKNLFRDNSSYRVPDK